jgi:DNA-binding HxlR family transcriptional regulator
MNSQQIQSEMFSQEELIQDIAAIFDSVSTDCKLEIIYLLIRIDEIPSGEIAKLTNCSPSQVSQSLAKMLQAGLLVKSRNWKEVSYSLNRKNPFVLGLSQLLSQSFTR